MDYIFSIKNNIFNGFYAGILNIICFVAFFAGVLTIITKNPIVSVIYLILLFGCIALYLIYIGLKFLGLSYLLVYVGAVSILFLFILMLINIRVSELLSDTSNAIPVALLAIATLYVPYSYVLDDNVNTVDQRITLFDTNSNMMNIMNVSSHSWDSNISEIHDIISIGNVMYTTYSIWLIIASIILLLAMVGSIVITIKQKY